MNIKLSVLIGGQTGWPDRMFLIPGGRPLFIEFKRPGGKVTAKQLYIHRLLRGLNYQVEVCDSVEGAVKAIKQAMETT